MKKIMIFLLCLIFAVSVAMTANASPSRLVDEADILTESEEMELIERLDDISERYLIDTVIVTVNSLDGAYAQDYADDYFDYNGYGMGEGYDGVLFLLSMGDREWAVSTHGKGMELMDGYMLDEVEEDVIPYLSEGDYAEAFSEFIWTCEMAYDESYSFINVVISLGIGFIVAFIAVSVMKAQLKSVEMKNQASDYVKGGSMVVTVSSDRFLHSTVTKTRRAQNNGGSGTHRSSSGRIHGGRSGRF